MKISQIRLRDDERIEWVGGYSDDFQQILADMLETHGIEDPHDREVVVVSRGSIIDHYEEFENARRHWRAADREKVRDYTEAYLQGAVFPPLIAESPGAWLVDGYHRLCVYSDVGDTEADFIYITRQPRELEDDECELSGRNGLS